MSRLLFKFKLLPSNQIQKKNLNLNYYYYYVLLANLKISRESTCIWGQNGIEIQVKNHSNKCQPIKILNEYILIAKLMILILYTLCIFNVT